MTRLNAMHEHLAPDTRTRWCRAFALALSLVSAVTASSLMGEAAAQDGFGAWDAIRAGLVFVTTAWLAWGASLALIGLPGRQRAGTHTDLSQPQPRTVIAVPICNEDPLTTFARIAAIDRSVAEAGVDADFVVLSDTRDAELARKEQLAFARLLRDTNGTGRMFYRRRQDNAGRKAGNIEEFIRTSGGAYEFAVILDADSLMEGETIRTMIARMQADPQLGLLQTLPQIIGARSFFGRALQFASCFHGPVFTRGLARMQGATGPFWGHNAIVRVRAFAQSCGLPELSGKPPLGGHILSHDYVEAALLARAGWKVQVDQTLGGSFEEGPENVLSFARRERRWCQGNLQHARLIFAPGLARWSRFIFLQNVAAYVVSLLWAAFLIASLIGTVTAPPPKYFPDPYQLFPVFPNTSTREITMLAVGVVGLLLVPKLLILIGAIRSGRAKGFGGAVRVAFSVLAEILLTTLLAPLMLLYHSRAVLQVLSGQDGGWPANQRNEGILSLSDGWQAGRWIIGIGIASLAAVEWMAPNLTIWLLPVALPMLAAPVLIAWTSRPLTHAVFTVPQATTLSPVVTSYRAIADSWRRTWVEDTAPTEPHSTGETHAPA
ncbi:glucans biosynthesis glucosyltransferase MdoH [Celeribacter halophilus]|uniref:glucans biosynthesis glucosyltransferase MdoH n=1 Tax=Celeribacter halophilus TaxID=576117 RepID=UPI00209128A8|nr:glucans biosynthesis glucosyltransferase MdoH [Celeribacter halophilus]MDO6509312.1 glucans biosynthesis glucosyltransferase MdoH [Celeribacter halophilus]